MSGAAIGKRHWEGPVVVRGNAGLGVGGGGAGGFVKYVVTVARGDREPYMYIYIHSFIYSFVHSYEHIYLYVGYVHKCLYTCLLSLLACI